MSLQKEADFGTPARAVANNRASKEDLITLSIDGVEVHVPEGTSVMRAAREIGRDIPKLCATDKLEAFGSCRMCLVEIEGMRGSPASCTTPVSAGMKVTTKNARLEKLRKGVMELYLSDHPLECLTCATNGDCELQDVAGEVGVRDVRYGYAGENHFDFDSRDPVDQSNPYFQFDSSKCILCSRCVRACDEVQGTLALTVQGRGFGSKFPLALHLMISFPRNASRVGPALPPAPPPLSSRLKLFNMGFQPDLLIPLAPIAGWDVRSAPNCKGMRSFAWCLLKRGGPMRGIPVSRVGLPLATRPTRTE